MKYIILILTCLVSMVDLHSQEIADSTRQTNPEISIDVGFQLPTGYYKNTYSSLLPSIGFGIAIPPTKKFRLKADLNFSWNNSQKAHLRQLRINLIGKYYLLLSNAYSVSVEGGLVMIREKEEFFASDGSNAGSTNTKGLAGYYVGTELEKRFEKYGTFLHLGYTISRNDIKSFFRDYSVLNLAIGGKVYF